MAGTPWKRRRESHPPEPAGRHAPEFVSTPAPPSASASTVTSSTWKPATQRYVAASSNPTVPTESLWSSRAAEYSAWADRLRQKGVEAHDTVTTMRAEPSTESHWSTDNVFTESRRIADNDLSAHRDPVAISAAYAVLELDLDADLEQVDARYRALAKQHHPDRFAGSDPEVQRDHADRFRAINTAREVLRQALGAS